MPARAASSRLKALCGRRGTFGQGVRQRRLPAAQRGFQPGQVQQVALGQTAAAVPGQVPKPAQSLAGFSVATLAEGQQGLANRQRSLPDTMGRDRAPGPRCHADRT